MLQPLHRCAWPALRQRSAAAAGPAGGAPASTCRCPVVRSATANARRPAAISSARLAPAWPLTSRSSSPAAWTGRGNGAARDSGHGGVAGQQRGHHFSQRGGAANVESRDARRDPGTQRREHQRAAGIGRLRQCPVPAPAPRAPGRSAPASDSSPANSHAASPRRVELPVGRQDAERDRQVEAARFLRQFGRRQVDGDPPVVGKGEAALCQRGRGPVRAIP